MTNALIAIIIAAVLVGTFMLCFAIEFSGDGFEPQDVLIDGPKALLGSALLLVAAVVAAVVWRV